MTSLKQLSNEWYLATALYDAIEDENIRAVISLIQEKHANPNVVIPDYGYTPLHLAVGHENQKFGKDVTKLLMKNGGDANITGVDGVTPLHVAVAWNRSAVVRLLLSYGADPWIKDDNEKDAFDYANEQKACDILRALEVLKHSKCREDRNYKIMLDKVIIHSNDVQAEYKAVHKMNEVEDDTTKKKQSVSTQTPRPFVRSSLENTNKQDSEILDNVNKFDSRYDWCDKSNCILNDACKRVIYQHRARSNMYEYTPRRSGSIASITSVECGNRIQLQETKKRYFPPICCVGNDLSLTDDSSAKNENEMKNDQPNVEENTNAKGFTDYENMFSEESLITDDQSSESNITIDKWDMSEMVKNIPYIDETTTSDSNSKTNSSHKPDADEPKMLCNEKLLNAESLQLNNQKEIVKHVTWPECLSTCACIPTYEDDDSFTVYSEAKNYSKKLDEADKITGGIETLPDETKFNKGREWKNANEDVKKISLEYKYTDDEDGIEFIAAKMPFSNSNLNKSNFRSSPEETDISDLSAYDTDYIRKELKELGFVSGPMNGISTKKLYLRKLKRIKRTVSSPMKYLLKQPAFSMELEQVLRPNTNWMETLSKWANLERELRVHFQDTSFSSTWCNGTAKMSFTYLLLDPRISNNLPARCENMDLMDVWRTFVRSIFYIGKGTRARPYEHLHEAFTVWHGTRTFIQKRNLKISHILDIWDEGMGVVCVQTFHHLIPAEAFTREAAMIDAIGLARLKNEKGGIYYGSIAKWNAKMKRQLGTFLLYRAMRMFIADNEIQIKPTDLN